MSSASVISSMLAVSTLTARPSVTQDYGSLIIVRRRNIVLPHRVIGKLLPHQQTAQIGMPLKHNPVRGQKSLAPETPRCATPESTKERCVLIRAVGRSAAAE